MKVLVLNAGSSSLKYQFLDTISKEVMAKGVVEKIGLESSIFSFSNGAHPKVEKNLPLKNHTEALNQVFASLMEGETSVINSLEEIDAIGHRVVHGGEQYNQTVKIDDTVLKNIHVLADLAPLHNPANAMGIEACKQISPNTPQVAVFDTAYHQTMEPTAYIYGIPYEYYEKYSIRRYGFHGTSYAYVAPKAAELLGKKIEDTNLIICHIGNGASMAAIRGGQCIDTSMGFTPLEGLLMGTRSGSIDPAVILYIMEKEGLNPTEAANLLNKDSGLKGISGISSDMRDVEAGAKEGNKRAVLAIEIMAHNIRKMLGSYLVELNGQVDAVVFTAGMGEFDTNLRALVTKDLQALGIDVDLEKNKANRSKYEDISTSDAKIRTLVVPTNEELEIALETEKILSK